MWRERNLGEAALACRYSPEIAISEGLAIWRARSSWAIRAGPWLRELVADLQLEIAADAVQREVTVERARGCCATSRLMRRSACGSLACPRRSCVLYWPSKRCGPMPGSTTTCVPPRAVGRGPRLQLHRQPPHHLVARGQGQTAGFGRLLREQLSPGQLRAQLGEPRALYPGSLV